MEPDQIIGLVGGVILIIISWVVTSKRERQLDDPDDDSVIYLDELKNKAKLQKGGKYLVRVLRQSGNLQKADQTLPSAEQAIGKVISTFKRARIEYVILEKNTETELFFRRPYYSHGGSAEGKKVGSAEIYKVE
ncbi:MAG: hypothetical protein HUJ16_04520 [Kangiella sp.]|nr:hypothetical protein [Kangiella sp.]